jgi:hypothetical protein
VYFCKKLVDQSDVYFLPRICVEPKAMGEFLWIFIGLSVRIDVDLGMKNNFGLWF